jgi:hypothetical protein
MKMHFLSTELPLEYRRCCSKSCSDCPLHPAPAIQVIFSWPQVPKEKTEYSLPNISANKKCLCETGQEHRCVLNLQYPNPNPNSEWHTRDIINFFIPHISEETTRHHIRNLAKRRNKELKTLGRGCKNTWNEMQMKIIVDYIKSNSPKIRKLKKIN